MSSGLLFDRQAVISWAMDEAPPGVVAMVLSGSDVFVSIVSLWEFLLKARFRSVGIDFNEMKLTLRALNARLLPIDVQHLETLRRLPFLGKHKDPFDRMIISQAISENLLLVGADREFPKYSKTAGGEDLKVIWK